MPRNDLEPIQKEMDVIVAFMQRVNGAGVELGLNPAQYAKCLANILASVVSDHDAINQTKFIDDLDALIDKYRATKLLQNTVAGRNI